MKVIITIPAFNEEKHIGKVIQDIKRVMGKTKYSYTILVIDDGSSDATAEIVRKLGCIVVSHPKNYGLAEAFKTEMQECLKLKADIIVHTDADGQYLADDIPRLLQAIKDGNDLVLGSRFMGHIEHMPLIKKMGNRAFSRIISNITGVNITDSQTGFRAFTREVAEQIEIISNFTYTQEQLIRAARLKFSIKEISADTQKTRKSKLMKNPFDFAVRAGINIFRIYRDYEPIKFFGGIGLVFLFGGFCIGLWLLSLLLRTGKIGHLPSTILTMLLILAGIQIILFGFLADMQRK